MLSHDQNEALTRVGVGTPMGDLFRLLKRQYQKCS